MIRSASCGWSACFLTMLLLASSAQAGTAAADDLVLRTGFEFHACGNSLVEDVETCDDSNTTDFDGCSSACKIEQGFACAGSPSVCMADCGDGVKLFDEECDDGNIATGDGCSTCHIDFGFMCAGSPSVCTSTCGDGLPASNEGCDDGNADLFDGCSACQVDPGYMCVGAPSICTPNM